MSRKDKLISLAILTIQSGVVVVTYYVATRSSANEKFYGETRAQNPAGFFLFDLMFIQFFACLLIGFPVLILYGFSRKRELEARPTKWTGGSPK